jgi:hypothetical protein
MKGWMGVVSIGAGGLEADPNQEDQSLSIGLGQVKSPDSQGASLDNNKP